MSAPGLMTAAHPEDPLLDMALTHALLREVGAGARGPLVRVFRPGRTLAFGRRDRLMPGFPAAVDVARADGFAPVLRSAGGHAAAYDRGSVVVERLVPVAEIAGGLEERFDVAAAELASVLGDRGLDARVGRLPGEYCPGAHSVNLGGAVKVAGVAQRIVRGAALVTAVLVVEHGAAIRAVIADVYAALGLEVERDVTGAVADADPAATAEEMVATIGRRVAPGAGAIEPDDDVLAAAEVLRERHAVRGRASRNAP